MLKRTLNDFQSLNPFSKPKSFYNIRFYRKWRSSTILKFRFKQCSFSMFMLEKKFLSCLPLFGKNGQECLSLGLFSIVLKCDYFQAILTSECMDAFEKIIAKGVKRTHFWPFTKNHRGQIRLVRKFEQYLKYLHFEPKDKNNKN